MKTSCQTLNSLLHADSMDAAVGLEELINVALADRRGDIADEDAELPEKKWTCLQYSNVKKQAFSELE